MRMLLSVRVLLSLAVVFYLARCRVRARRVQVQAAGNRLYDRSVRSKVKSILSGKTESDSSAASSDGEDKKKDKKDKHDKKDKKKKLAKDSGNAKCSFNRHHRKRVGVMATLEREL